MIGADAEGVEINYSTVGVLVDEHIAPLGVDIDLAGDRVRVGGQLPDDAEGRCQHESGEQDAEGACCPGHFRVQFETGHLCLLNRFDKKKC